MFDLLLIKAIHLSRGGRVEVMMFRKLRLPFAPYAGLRILVGGRTPYIKAEDFVWIPDRSHFRCDLEPDFLEESVSRGGSTTLEDLVAGNEAFGLAIMTQADRAKEFG